MLISTKYQANITKHIRLISAKYQANITKNIRLISAKISGQYHQKYQANISKNRDTQGSKKYIQSRYYKNIRRPRRISPGADIGRIGESLRGAPVGVASPLPSPPKPVGCHREAPDATRKVNVGPVPATPLATLCHGLWSILGPPPPIPVIPLPAGGPGTPFRQ